MRRVVQSNSYWLLGFLLLLLHAIAVECSLLDGCLQLEVFLTHFLKLLRDSDGDAQFIAHFVTQDLFLLLTLGKSLVPLGLRFSF